jgi:hypothetical protein
MGLSTAISAQEYDPALRALGKLPSSSTCLLEGLCLVGRETETLHAETVEGHVGEKSEIAGFPQISQPLLSDLIQLALTRDGTTEVGVPRGDISAQIASTAAKRTDFRALST